MRCPRCQVDDDKVLETRILANGAMIRRRRMCLHCDSRFTSYERIEETPLIIVKRNNTREEFSREKLAYSINIATRKRSISTKTIKNVLDFVEEQAILNSGNNNEISSEFLGELIISELQKIDTVAYLRFVSVYRNFESVEEFMKEITILSKHNVNKK